MSNIVKGLIAVVVVALGGVLVWFFATSGAEPTTDVTAPAIGETTTTGAAATTTAGGEPAADQPEDGARLFELTADTTASFELDEELRGSPNTVVGTSDQVVGQIQIDPDDLAQSEIGTILINARAFETDSSLRDRAINGPILDTGAFEFIEFAPTSIEGLSGSIEVGQTYEFSVTGDLTIRDVTQQVTFDVSATLVSEDRLEGTAQTTVTRTQFDLQIPSVPSVANVSDEVQLRLDFAATPAG